MKIAIRPNEFEHDNNISSYNNNYYIHASGFVIRENCKEDYNYYSFYLVENGVDIFIGDSYGSFSDELIEFDFKIEYT